MFCTNPKQQVIIVNLEKTVEKLEAELKALQGKKEEEEAILKIEIEQQKDVIEFLTAEKARLEAQPKSPSIKESSSDEGVAGQKTTKGLGVTDGSLEHLKIGQEKSKDHHKSHDSKHSLVGMISEIHSHSSDQSLGSDKTSKAKSVDHLVSSVKEELKNDQYSTDACRIRIESLVKALEEEHQKKSNLEKETHQLSAKNKDLATALEHAKIDQQRVESKFIELEEKITGFDDDESTNNFMDGLAGKMKTPSERLDHKIAQLNGLISAKNILINELKEKNSVLKEEIEITHDELYIFKEETRRKLEHMRVNFNDAQTKRDEWEKKYQALRQKPNPEQELASLRMANEETGKVLSQSRLDLEKALEPIANSSAQNTMHDRSRSISTDSMTRSSQYQKIQGLEEKLAQSEAEARDLKTRLAQASDIGSGDKLKALEDSLATLNVELREKAEKLRVSASKEKQLEDSLNKARKEIEEKADALKRLEAASQSTSKTPGNQGQEIQVLESVKEELLQELEEKNKDLDSAIKEIGGLIDKNQLQEKEIQTLQESVKSAKEETLALEKSNEKLQGSLAKAEKDIAASATEYKQHNSALSDQIYNYQNQVRGLQEELASQAKTFDAEVSSLKKDAVIAKERVDNLRAEIEQAQASKSEACEKLETTITELQARISGLEAQLDNKAPESPDQQQKEEEIEAIRTERDSLQTQVDSLTDKIDQILCDMELEQSKGKSSMMHIQEMQGKVDRVTEENEALQSEIRKLRDEGLLKQSNTQALLDEAERKLSQTFKQLEAERAAHKNDQGRDSVAELQKKLEDAAEKIKVMEEYISARDNDKLASEDKIRTLEDQVKKQGNFSNIRTEDPMNKSGYSILFKNGNDLSQLSEQQVIGLKEKIIKMTQELETKNKVIAQYVLRDQTIDVETLKQKPKGSSLSMLVSSAKTSKDPVLLAEINNKLQVVLADLTAKNQDLEDSNKMLRSENDALKGGLQPI